MTNKNEQRKVPELRFPEFSGEWEEKRVEELYDFKNGLNKGKEFFGKGTPIVNFKDVFNNRELKIADLKGKVEVTEKEKELYSVKKGDLFFTRTSEIIEEIGMPAVITENMNNTVFSGFVLRARIKENKQDLNNYFKKYVFITSSFRQEMIKKSSMTTRALTSGTAINKMIFHAPKTFEEQQKIGEFFSKLDRQIELEEKKLALLEDQKKGYMQKIFSQELRFKDENGEEYPEWEDLRLGDIFHEINDKTSINNEYPILSSTNNGLFSQKDYFKHQVASNNNIGYKILKKNQVVLSPQNLWLGNININFIFEEGIVSPSYKIFNIINSNPLFISYILKRPKMLFEYKNASEQGASIVRRNLNLDLFYNIKLRLPSCEEQTSIQNFLRAIENQIDKSDFKINMLNLRKNYLLNKIFL